MKKIYSIVENIHNNPDFFVYSYSSYDKAREDFDKLVNTYKKDYSELFENEDDYELRDNFLSIYDIVDIQIVENVLE